MSDTPLRLRDAAEIYGFTIDELKAEYKRGRLSCYKIGRALRTRPSDIEQMITECRVEPKAPVSIVIRRAVSTSSETARASLDSANQALLKLRNTSRNTSPKSIALGHRRVR